MMVLQNLKNLHLVAPPECREKSHIAIFETASNGRFDKKKR